MISIKFFSTGKLLAFTFMFCLTPVFAQVPLTPEMSFGCGAFNGPVEAIAVQNDGRIICGGQFTYFKTHSANRIVRLLPSYEIDKSFSIVTGANEVINCVQIQPDGKILLAGQFTSFNNNPHKGIIRLNSDGTVDNTFNTGSGLASNRGLYNFAATVNSMVLQADGKIIVAGFINSYNGVPSNGVVRLNSNGSIDESFAIGTGANSEVASVAQQQDGKIVLAGDFTTFNEVVKKRVVRLNIDGTIDPSFDIGNGADVKVRTIFIQQDQKILLGGNYVYFNNVYKPRFVRLNSNGSVDNSFNVGTGVNGVIRSIIFQDGKYIIAGEFSLYNGTTGNKGIFRILPDGTADNSFVIPRSDSDSQPVSVYSVALHSNKILVGGNFSMYEVYDGTANYFTVLNSNGSTNKDFEISRGVHLIKNGTSTQINSIAISKEGKIAVAGSFRTFNGTLRSNIAMVNPDGSVDSSFQIGTNPNNIINGFNDVIHTVAHLNDGKVLVGGKFTVVNQKVKHKIARLNKDGSIDESFTAALGTVDQVNAIVVQPDGKILVGGNFRVANGDSTRKHFTRLNADGSLDNTFLTRMGLYSQEIKSITLQTDGKIIIAGSFMNFNNTGIRDLARLNPDGSLDNTFSKSTSLIGVFSVAMQQDGKIIIGGAFSFYDNSVNIKYLARLNTNGSVDHTFNTASPDGSITDLLVQPDDKILVGGTFTYFNGLPNKYFVRLNSNGTLDNKYKPGTGFNTGVSCFALQADGKIIIAGGFSLYNGMAFNKIIRLNSDFYNNKISGIIYTDSNKDCIPKASERKLNSLIVTSSPDNYFTNTNIDGGYTLLVDSGSVTHTLTHSTNPIQQKLYLNQCATSHDVSLTGSGKDTCCFNFADSLRSCSLLNVTIQKTRLRRCFRNGTIVNYCNYGNSPAPNAQIRIVYPSYVVPVNSTPMWTSKQDSILIYDLNTISADSCGKIFIIDSVACGMEEIRGITRCIKAIITPSTKCVEESPAWDKSSIKVSGTCKSGNAVFTITNAGSGDMHTSHEYRIFVNDTLIYSNTFQLMSGEKFTVSYPAGGNTIRLEADQHPLHPGKSRPRETVEGCNSSTSTVAWRTRPTTAPLDDLDEDMASTCNPIVDSYDPNDKQAIPIGIGSSRRIVDGTELEYIIRFQNTGTDTAYTVKVIDTLDVSLDPSSFTEGVSSHPYSLEVSGKGTAVLSFTFNRINLPDSTVNKTGSNGVVSFRLTVPSGTPSGTVIKNKAYIYFDYNSPIITNETIHTIDPGVDMDLSRGSQVIVGQVTGLAKNQAAKFSLYPNPTSGILKVQIYDSKSETKLRIVSLLGIIERSYSLDTTGVQEINLDGLSRGIYMYEFLYEGIRQGSGLLQVGN